VPMVRHAVLLGVLAVLAECSSIGLDGDTATLAPDEPSLSEFSIPSAAIAAARTKHVQLRRAIKREKDELREDRRTLEGAHARLEVLEKQNAAAQKAKQVLKTLIGDRNSILEITQTQQTRDLGESYAVPAIASYQGPLDIDPEKKLKVAKDKTFNVAADPKAGFLFHSILTPPKNRDGTVTVVDDDAQMAYDHAAAGTAKLAIVGAVGKELAALKKRYPELGIWAGYRTPEPKVEALTKEGVAEEERRERLTPKERAEEDATRTAAVPAEEVKKAFILPPPLVYTPPLDSEEVIEERARESKVKENRKTFRAQAKANENAAKLVVAAEKGINVKKKKNKRKINYAGIFCTESKTSGCVRLDPLYKKLQCDVHLQRCRFKSPSSPHKFIYTEPIIPCPEGQQQCVIGAAKIEGERRQQRDERIVKSQWKTVNQAAKQMEIDQKKTHLENKKEAKDKVALKMQLVKKAFINAALEVNRPTKKVYKPLPQLEPVDTLVPLREQAIKMRQKVGAVHTLLKKLGILTLGCEESHTRCTKQCMTGRRSIRKDPDGSKCKLSCTKNKQDCMVTRIKRAQFAAKVTSTKPATQNPVPQERLIQLDATPKTPVVSDAELTKNPKLAKLSKACEDGVPGGCDQLKTDLEKERKKLAAKQASAAKPSAQATAKPSAKPGSKGDPESETGKHPAKKVEGKPNENPTENPTNAKQDKEQKRVTMVQQVKALAKKQAVKLATKLEVRADMKAAEVAAKKETVQQQVANHQYECMKAHKKSCEKKVLKAYIKAQKKHKKVNNDDLKDREKRRKRCLEKAKLKCEKKVIMQMTRKFDSKTMKLIKTNQKKEQLLKQIVPWQKEQKEKKQESISTVAKEKDGKQAAQMKAIQQSQSKVAKQIASQALQRRPVAMPAHNVSTSSVFTQKPGDVTATENLPADCRDEWAHDVCHHATEHCANHDVLRYKCKLTCKACTETFPYHSPTNETVALLPSSLRSKYSRAPVKNQTRIANHTNKPAGANNIADQLVVT